MPFWKQSDDPWDRKPEKRRPEPMDAKELEESLMDSLKRWGETRRAEEAAKAAPDLPPETCPWCGKDMEQGYMMGGKGIHWYPGVITTKAAWFGDFTKGQINLENESFLLAYYKTVWLCRECGKMVFDAPWEERVFDFPEAQGDETTETTQEEETSED